MKLEKLHSVHFVGIKGVGMTPLAVIAKEAGMKVTGSDIADGFITDEILQRAGIEVSVGFVPDNVGNVDLVITTGAHKGYDNPEVVFAKQQNIPIMTQGEAVGYFMSGQPFDRKLKGISIAGTHGKTTTTAMIATILKTAKRNPSWVVGTGNIPSLGNPGHYGMGEYFVAEADEYATEPVFDKTTKFLWQHPVILVITNIEFDHPDLYASLEEVRGAFEKFASQLPKDATLIACGDDKEVQKLLRHFKGKAITYGYDQKNDYIVTDKTFSLGIPGEHNRLNATAAYIVGELCGIEKKVIETGLQSFHGTKRRMEYMGQLQSGALLYDDYAHHPTEIRKTLTTFRETYPDKNIVCIFQPHTYSRTKLLFEEFVDSLLLADTIVMTDIYASEREKKDASVSSALLANSLKEQGKEVFYQPSLSDVVKYINQYQFGSNILVVLMGAGDIYKVAYEIL